MLSRLNKRSGSKYTLISIILIIIMLYFLRFALGGKEEEYPQAVYFDGQKYTYSQTIKGSSLGFKRNYGKSYEGHVLLSKRGEGLSKVYIFDGWKTYREYVIDK